MVIKYFLEFIKTAINKTKETTVDSTTMKWHGGVVGEVTINQCEDEEEEV